MSGAGAIRALAGRAGQVTFKVGANKLVHVFGKAAHNLGGLVQAYGSREAAYLAVERAAQAAVTAGNIAGRFEVVVTVAGHQVTVRGIVINGVMNIGTFFIK